MRTEPAPTRKKGISCLALLNHAGTPISFPRNTSVPQNEERSGMESKLRVTDGMLILHCRDGCHSTKQEDKPRSIWQRSRPPESNNSFALTSEESRRLSRRRWCGLHL
ncbi:hypothetical protein CDAR_459371 [Caerostris darwini]|uniref:Uncharacterized protein n=1 Tax=Caerostris darwini TaxID=1538125 RepID=A0AAV4UDC6_9ARAC|nr:hypothetical protein CDAR_459371 [Caerostris darwini]